MPATNNHSIIHEHSNAGFERTIAYLGNLMVTVCHFTNGPAADPDPPHSHTHEQITYVAEGKLIFHKGDESLKLEKGDIITIPSNVSHCIQTLTDNVILIDSFSPVRTDFLIKK